MALALLCACAHQNKPTAPEKLAAKGLAEKDFLAKIRCPASDTTSLKVLKMKLNKDHELVACGKLEQELSETVFVLSNFRLVNVHWADQKVSVIVDLKENEHREVLWDTSGQRVLLFEDVPLEKKLPLFSQEISCKSGSCSISDKVCLFRKDEKAFVDPLKTTDLNPLMNETDGQVKILLAALSDFKPAIEVYRNRTPQSVDSKVAESFRLRKSQLLQAELICK